MSKQERYLISVVIPNYNRANTVGETIESIVAQEGRGTEFDVEIVIGDDCSTDNAREVLEHYRQKYPDLIRLFLREENLGLGANWAQCVKDCRGKYICNCDNDDYWHNPNKLQLQLDYMESHPQSNVLLTNHRSHNRETGVITEAVASISRDKPLQHAVWGDGKTGFCNATIMYRADFLKSHLDLDEFIHRRLSLQDWPAWVILAAYTDFDILPVSTATFGIETQSITRPKSIERLRKRYEGDKEVYRYLCELFPSEFPFDEKEWELYTNGRLMAQAFDLGDFVHAREYGVHATGVSRLKQFCSQHRLFFYLFRLGKKANMFR
ncbi:MAG: glycosyltransferase family 2 protein [Paludibacteraceae bacterium]